MYVKLNVIVRVKAIKFPFKFIYYQSQGSHTSS